MFAASLLPYKNRKSHYSRCDYSTASRLLSHFRLVMILLFVCRLLFIVVVCYCFLLFVCLFVCLFVGCCCLLFLLCTIKRRTTTAATTTITTTTTTTTTSITTEQQTNDVVCLLLFCVLFGCCLLFVVCCFPKRSPQTSNSFDFACGHWLKLLPQLLQDLLIKKRPMTLSVVVCFCFFSVCWPM